MLANWRNKQYYDENKKNHFSMSVDNIFKSQMSINLETSINLKVNISELKSHKHIKQGGNYFCPRATLGL